MTFLSSAARAIAAAAVLAATLAHEARAQELLARDRSAGVVFESLESLRTPSTHRGALEFSAAPSLAGSAVEYLILTVPDFAAEFERLATWKTHKGVPTVVRTLDDIHTSRAGSDLAETLRNYIRDAYLYWGVRFVLLGGDTEFIPGRYVELDLLQLRRPISELYYACLDGTWNADGDAFFGEPSSGAGDPGDAVDLQAEVFVGRAPVSTVREAAVFVDKTLRHERPDDTSFQERLLLMAEALFPSDWHPGDPPPTADGALFAEEIAALAPHTRATRLYEANDLWDDAQPLTLDAGRDALTSGYGTVVHVGHGYRYTLSLGDGSLDVPDANRLANGTRAGVFYMLNCTATAFDFDSIAEALLLNSDGGATLVVGAAREAFPLAARDYQKAFFEEAFVRGERRVGAAMSRSRERVVAGRPITLVDLWTQYVYTLLGDPEAPLWSRVGPELSITGLPATLAVGRQELRVEVRSASNALAAARVCLFKSGDEYRVAYTNEEGVARMDVQLNDVGDAILTVTAVDHVPYQATLAVVAPVVALSVVSSGLDDDGGGSGRGNRDGIVDAGETVTLHVPLHNRGGATLGELTARLRAEDVGLEVLQGTSSYPDLEPGMQAPAATPFEVRVSSTLTDGRRVRLRLDIEHAGGGEQRRLELPVAAARPQLVALRLDDSRAGNGDGVQDPGEEVDLVYSVVNRGGGTATGVQLELLDPSAGLEVLTARAALEAIPSGAIREHTTPLTIREIDLDVSRTMRLVLRSHQNPDGVQHTLETRRPPAPTGVRFDNVNAADAIHLVWAPTDIPDLYGYNVYRAVSPEGPFERVNEDVVLQSYFRDTGLTASTRYHYRVTALDFGLFESPGSVVTSASTNPPQLAGWPLAVDDFSSSTPAVGDIDADGAPDVVAAARQVFAWDTAGVELHDADDNALTWGVFAGDREVYGSITLADMDAQVGHEIVVSTWDAEQRFVTLLDGRGRNLPGWPQPLVAASEAQRGAHVPPVVARLDGTEPRPAVLLAARDGRLYGWHADGREIADGDADPSTHGVLLDTGSPFLRSAPGVADLDPARPGMEIALGSSDGTLYVLGSDGRPLPGWPRSVGGDGEAFGSILGSGITIADVDHDGTAEMFFLESRGRLHAMHLDGLELAGYPIDGLRATGTGITPSVAVGDLAGDAALEIVAATSDGRVHVFDHTGQALLQEPLDTGARSESSPVLGDVDGDGEVEIVFGNEDGIVYAWNLDATPVDGFPIALDSEMRATPVLADVEGKAVLVLQAWSGEISVVRLGVAWEEARFPWPMHRGNIHRTGEFGFEVPRPRYLEGFDIDAHPDGRVVLTWRTVGDSTRLDWAVLRAGPYPSAPRLEADLRVALREIALVSAAGAARFEDHTPRNGQWYVYAIESRDPRGDGQLVGWRRVQVTAPAVLHLHPAVPNPFNPGTRLRFDVPVAAGAAPTTLQPVRLEIFDARGRRVRRLLEGTRPAGTHHVDWDGRDQDGRAVASGVYVVRLEAAGATRSQKLVRVR